MAAISQRGEMPTFLSELAQDADLDDETKGTLAELANDDTFLLARRGLLAARAAGSLPPRVPVPPALAHAGSQA